MLEAEIYRFFSDRRRVLARGAIFYRPSPIMLIALYLSPNSPRNYIYATASFYSLFIALIFSIYRLPGRLSKELSGPALLELIYTTRTKFFLSRLASTLIIAFVLSLIPILSVFLAAVPMLGLKVIVIGPVVAFLAILYAIAIASLGLLFVRFRNSAYTLTATYLTIIASTAVPYLLYASLGSPKYLLALILSPGFSPAMALYYTLIRLGARGIRNDIRAIYASNAGKNPYYPGFFLGLMPTIVYFIVFIAIFRLRFRYADLRSIAFINSSKEGALMPYL